MSKFQLTFNADTAEELQKAVTDYWLELPGGKKPDLEIKEVQEDFLTQVAAQNVEVPMPTEPMIPEDAASSATPTKQATSHATETDSRGFPWDARIHAASKAVTKDGSWRYKRGVEEASIKSVEQELIAKVKKEQLSEPEVVAPMPVIPPVPQAPMPPPQLVPNAHSVETFKRTLVPTLAKLVKDGKLTQEYVGQLKAHFGVDEIHKVSEAQAEEMFNNFVAYGMIAKAE